MRKTVLLFIASAMVVVGIVMWALNTDISGSPKELIMIGIALILVGFAVYIGIQRIRSLRRKEAAEDELSKKMMLKASSLSYYISLYLWLFIGYFSDVTKLETHTLIGAGILGMALIFFLSWLGVKTNLIKNG